MTDATLPTARLEHTPINRIRFYSNVRRDAKRAELEAMMRSLSTAGLVEPPTLRPLGDGHFTPITGHIRISAARELGWQVIPALIESRALSSAYVIAAQLATAVCRADLNDADFGKGCDEWIRITGRSAKELAEYLGSSEATVSRARAIVGLPEPLLALVAAKKVAASVALDLMHVRDADVRERLMRKAEVGELTRADVYASRKPHRHRRAARRSVLSRSFTVKLDHGCSLKVPDAGCTADELLALLDELAGKVRAAKASAPDLASLFAQLALPRTD